MTDRPSTQDIPDDDADVRRIKEVFAELEAAFAEQGAAGFDGRFTADIVFTAVNGRRFHGWEESHAYHKERLENHADGIRTWYEIDRITFPAPDVAVAFVRQPVATPVDERTNVGTWVLVKKNGQWWVSAIQNTGVAKA
ncbi:SgcJ/EcaC family oxidoreductase [Allosalinactinospora lopnorensis]|uniref:SgcJ/EcaC family oxidoreductase n=1 Tax=Allosalinactinospora lopnorensis TaxID=1352348 RepID=UPI000623DF34|nr:SgcJ/EcaC family oxidoreductase [Allosalinactinospora lopnorensis]